MCEKIVCYMCKKPPNGIAWYQGNGKFACNDCCKPKEKSATMKALDTLLAMGENYEKI